MKSLTPLLNVDDAARSIEFYSGVLGFNVDHSFEYGGKVLWARLSHGPIGIMVNVSHEHTRRAPRPMPQTYEDIVLYFSVADVRELHGRLESKGCNPGPVERQDYGVDEFTMRDPDGYELAFASPIAS